MVRRRAPQTTRRRILYAAFREFHRRGFQTADLNSILREAGVTKGALYHHFQSKLGLGYAVVEEVLRDWILDRWLDPVATADAPLDALADLARWGEQAATPESLSLGCPLLCLAEEMSGIDEGFRRRLANIYRDWREGLAAALRRAQQRGSVGAEVDTELAAAFIIAAWEGSVALAKNERSSATLGACRRGLEAYLQTLRP